MYILDTKKTIENVFKSCQEHVPQNIIVKQMHTHFSITKIEKKRKEKKIENNGVKKNGRMEMILYPKRKAKEGDLILERIQSVCHPITLMNQQTNKTKQRNKQTIDP